ncbi:hypothetical protein CVT25_006736 [Psilocybe cyanescens]|uniref:Uncharacterized protein n=1 Tax=Psilocybe cyanescens TaxID=93625 RepID=A0A409X465_PSICY|nr:hypothetical protein CVT25_006736 [Psilocybe cyanescens]
MNNLEQAIVNVLPSNQVPDYNNVFRAYASISRLPNTIGSVEAPKFFYRVMGKSPASRERTQALFGDYVTSIRKQLMQIRLDLLTLYMPSDKLLPCLLESADELVVTLDTGLLF